MKQANRDLSHAMRVPWVAYALGLVGGGLLLGTDELVFRVFGVVLGLAGAAWLIFWSRKIHDFIDRILAAIPLQGKTEALLRELPKAWSELEQENLALKLRARQEDQFRLAILANLRVGIVLFGPDRKVRLFNPSAQLLLGTSSHLSPGEDLITVFREPESLRFLEKAFQGDGMEWELRRNPRVIQVRAVPMLDPVGAGEAVLLTLDDVTRQEALEITRQKFISNASHELKTPTTSIRIAAENLLEGHFVVPEGEPSLQSIFRSVDRMTMLLNDISELSRIETGALTLHPEEIQMEEFVHSLFDDLRPRAGSRRIDLRAHFPDDLRGCLFRADPLRFHQLLENLLSNAIKFSPEDSEVLLSVKRDGRWLIWSVADRGPGIAPSEAQRIFERFYRSPSARGVPGTGLGLSIVKHLAALMNGEIDLKSDLGQGATFTLRIPMTETET